MKRLLLLSLFLVAVTAVAAENRPPNILFIIFDDWGGSTHASVNGCDWIKTPNFDRVAREGVLFKNAFTSNPKCSPCRASILTGLYVHHHGVLGNSGAHGGWRVFDPSSTIARIARRCRSSIASFCAFHPIFLMTTVATATA